MKANYISRVTLAACLVTGISLTSCKKDNTSSTSGSSDTEVSTASDDQSQVSGESEAMNDDANTALSGSASFSGTASDVSHSGGTETNSTATYASGTSWTRTDLICDATITYDTAGGNRTITIVYNGTNCAGNRTRTGTVTISMPSNEHWKDAGATATLTAKDVKITRVRDGKSITINGEKTFTNVSGGLLADLSSAGSITHTVTSTGISITFDNGSQRSWQIAKQRVYTYDNGIVLTTSGTHTDGTHTGIAEWGTNRYGNAFTSIISSPRIFRQDCDFRLTAGVDSLINNAGSTVITYGLDSSGNPTGCPGTGTYYFKIVFTSAKNGNVYTAILPY